MHKVTSYHHGDLRQALVKTAYIQARHGGLEALSLRAIARQNHVSPSAVYRHFANHEDLLRALKELISFEVAKTMEQYMQKASQLPPQALADARLRQLCHGYIAFALNEPGLFRTVSSPQTGQLYDVEQLQGHAPFQALKRALAPFVSVGQVLPAAELLAEMSIWATVHGLAVLLLDTPLSVMKQKERQALIDYAIEMALKGVGI